MPSRPSFPGNQPSFKQGYELNLLRPFLFFVSIGGRLLLFNPFIMLNGLANALVDADAIRADFILLSHGHQDHIADCVRIATQTGAKVICNVEIEEWLNKQGGTNIRPLAAGGKWNFGDFTVGATVAQYCTGLPDGSQGGNLMGFIVPARKAVFIIAEIRHSPLICS